MDAFVVLTAAIRSHFHPADDAVCVIRYDSLRLQSLLKAISWITYAVHLETIMDPLETSGIHFRVWSANSGSTITFTTIFPFFSPPGWTMSRGMWQTKGIKM